MPDGAGSANETKRAYVRNQCLNAPQANPPARNLADMGRDASRTRPDSLAERFTYLTAARVAADGRREVLGFDVGAKDGAFWKALLRG